MLSVPISSKKFCICLVILLTQSLIFLAYKQYTAKFDNVNPIINYENKPLNKSNGKTILLWNAFFTSETWYLPATKDNIWNETFFQQINCPETNCIITTNRNYLTSIDEFDAILIHGAESFEKPPIRKPNQLYIIAILESPAYIRSNLRDVDNYFNLTMSYRLNSDIHWTYGNLKDKNTGNIVSPIKKPIWRKPPKNIRIAENRRNLIKNKPKMGAWFVSHCKAISKRDELITSLQKYIEVDIYGRCGPYKCPRQSTICDDLLDSTYKFYFSFENALCKDYVTEKFFNALKRNIVPVVFGGANYNYFAPPYSYINANQFNTSKDLAEYLLYLDKNIDEYAKYFWWKEHYTVTSRPHFCQLCSRLSDPNENEKMQFYKSIYDWWYGYSCDLKSKISF